MTLLKLLDDMETQAYQTQFSVLSGFKSLLRAFSRDRHVKLLIEEALNDRRHTMTVSQSIERLLAVEDPRYYDESIAAYLYCLSEVDPAMALKASEGILSAGGVDWSMRLALHIQEEAQTQAA